MTVGVTYLGEGNGEAYTAAFPGACEASDEASNGVRDINSIFLIQPLRMTLVGRLVVGFIVVLSRDEIDLELLERCYELHG